MSLFKRQEEKKDRVYTRKEVDQIVLNALLSEQFDFSALWEEAQQEKGFFAKMAPVLTVILQAIVLILILTKK